MTPAQFKISFDLIPEILKEFGLFRMKGTKNISNDGVSEEFLSASIKENYFQAYRIGLENYDFDFILEDQSYFQFECSFNDQLKIRYSFYQNPVEFISYNEYLQNEIDRSGLDESIEDLGMLMTDEYDQFLNDQELISNYTTFRYDIDYGNYRPLIHSISHMHVGHITNVRIPIEKIISPLRFVLFTIKHVYYRQWKEMVENKGSKVNRYLALARNGEQVLGNHDWSLSEKLDIYLK
ncbi:DUF2290 domain-containing protein [Marinifilum fragile]|uniref:DUF2290 domain-containing protein n=1 Tax=Marinifilum fragile TaxID=570161 RepID=UPI0006CF8E2B|nr:DUF2290 domain-containing protein [Marinifilum fragile]